MTIDLSALFMPCIDLLKEWLTIDVLFFGHSFKLWGIFAFILMLGIFVRLIQFLTGVDLGSDNTVERDIHVGGFHD